MKESIETAPNREPVPIELGDGKTRHLRYSINATKELRKKYGTMAKLMETDFVEVLPDCIYLGLVEKDGMSAEKIGDMVDLRDMQALRMRFLLAFTGVDHDKIQAQLAEAIAKDSAASEAPNELTQPVN